MKKEPDLGRKRFKPALQVWTGLARTGGVFDAVATATIRVESGLPDGAFDEEFRSNRNLPAHPPFPPMEKSG